MMRIEEKIMKTILIVDDDIDIGNLEQEVLEKEGYLVKRAYSGTETLLFLENNRVDLILLDLMLPGLSGEDVLAKIKNIPTIVVSAKIGIDDKVAMLFSGACDYITKPFDSKELLARVYLRLQENENSNKSEIFSYKNLVLDKNSQKVSEFEKSVFLTRTEYAILKLLIQNPKQVIAKSVILDRIMNEAPECSENSLKTHISNLRNKLRKISDKNYIESVWGIGFKLE